MAIRVSCNECNSIDSFTDLSTLVLKAKKSILQDMLSFGLTKIVHRILTYIIAHAFSESKMLLSLSSGCPPSICHLFNQEEIISYP
jgi:hypothetical protein